MVLEDWSRLCVTRVLSETGRGRIRLCCSELLVSYNGVILSVLSSRSLGGVASAHNSVASVH